MWRGETDNGECRAIINDVLRNEVERARLKRSGWEASKLGGKRCGSVSGAK
jgi:hypothetical protein